MSTSVVCAWYTPALPWVSIALTNIVTLSQQSYTCNSWPESLQLAITCWGYSHLISAITSSRPHSYAGVTGRWGLLSYAQNWLRLVLFKWSSCIRQCKRKLVAAYLTNCNQISVLCRAEIPTTESFHMNYCWSFMIHTSHFNHLWYNTVINC